MRLYLFEHCSICFRVRMAAALKRLHLQEAVVLEDDSDTMIHLVGKRVVPILVKDDGQPMLESMDMVGYIDGLGDPVLTGPQRSEIAACADTIVAKAVPLTWPRYPLLGLPDSRLPRRIVLPREGERLWVIAVARTANRPLLEASSVAAARAGVVNVPGVPTDADRAHVGWSSGHGPSPAASRKIFSAATGSSGST